MPGMFCYDYYIGSANKGQNIMAYIDSKTIKKFRDAIKAEYPASKGWKWSVTGHNHSSVKASLMAYPKGYIFPGRASVNHFWLDESGYGKKEIAVLKKVKEILHSEHWDKSDIMTDYFNCAYYVTMEIGKWDRDAVMTTPKAKKKPAKRAPVAKPTGYGLSDSECKMIASSIGINF